MKPLNTTDPSEKLTTTLGDIFDYGRLGFLRGSCEAVCGAINSMILSVAEVAQGRPSESLYQALGELQTRGQSLGQSLQRLSGHLHNAFVEVGARIRPEEAVRLSATQAPAEG